MIPPTAADCTPIEAYVVVRNTGTMPEAYFLDARRSDQVRLKLAAQTTARLTLPDVTGVVPAYLVPSHTTALKATASSPDPLFFDLTYPYGDPDVISSTGKTATASYSAAGTGAGDWTITPFLTGPFGKKAAKHVTATTSMTATARFATGPRVSSRHAAGAHHRAAGAIRRCRRTWGSAGRTCTRRGGV